MGGDRGEIGHYPLHIAEKLSDSSMLGMQGMQKRSPASGAIPCTLKDRLRAFQAQGRRLSRVADLEAKPLCHTQMNVDVGHGGRGHGGSTSFPLRLFIAGTWTWASIAGSFEGSNDVGPVKVVSMVSPGPAGLDGHGGRGLAPLVELARGHGGRSR